mmetsp:Transcript_13172/g.57434  ORF Transcript_13172/g.57434 Transcript_13172/m.57434 type:complete len:259 (-) Transcript_13172:273-1049(-)
MLDTHAPASAVRPSACAAAAAARSFESSPRAGAASIEQTARRITDISTPSASLSRSVYALRVSLQLRSSARRHPASSLSIERSFVVPSAAPFLALLRSSVSSPFRSPSRAPGPKPPAPCAKAVASSCVSDETPPPGTSTGAMSTFMTGSYTSSVMKYRTSAFLLTLSSTAHTTVSMHRTASLLSATGRSWFAAHAAHREMRSAKNASHDSCPPAQVSMTPRLRSGNGALAICRSSTQSSSRARLRRRSTPSSMRPDAR